MTSYTLKARGLALGAAAICLMLVSSEVLAQRGGGGGRGGRGQGRRGGRGAVQMEPEQAKKVYGLQATSFATDAGVSAERIVAAYTSARESYAAKSAELTQGLRGGRGGGGGGDFQALIAEMNTATAAAKTVETEKMMAAIGGSLDEEQTEKAKATLATFSTEWDRHVNALTQLELGDDTLNSALAAVLAYVPEYEKALAESGGGGFGGFGRGGRGGGGRGGRGGGGGGRGGGGRGGRGGRGGIAGEARQALNASMGEVLSEEQMTQYQQLTRGRRRGGRG